jgi:glycosyltransferase involved in cell wall biosynthesis/GT2 family glycosyltransferase
MAPKHALVCSYYIPQTDLDSYSRRLFHLIEFLRSSGWLVTVLAEKGAASEFSATRLRHMGIPLYFNISKNTEALLEAQLFDLAILGFWHIAERVIPTIRNLSPATRVVVDSGDIHLLRNARRIFRSRSEQGWPSQLDSDYAAAMIKELNTYASADAVLAVSQKEADLIGDMTADDTLCFAIPDCEDLEPSRISRNKRRGLLFVGNFEHPPNVEALQYFCGEILPRLPEAIRKKHPVHIVGNALKPSVAEAAEKIGHVRAIGWVPSVIPYIERACVAVVPVLHGAGTKRKLLQALAVGTPAVSSSIGAEGLNLRDEEDILIADDPDSFARAIARLVSDSQLWKRLQKNGRTHLAAEQGREVVSQRFLDTIDLVLAREQSKAAFVRFAKAENPSILEYRKLVQRIKDLARRKLPAYAQIAVVSRGDDELLNLNRQLGWHFPQGLNNVYAGYHPRNSNEAIRHLQRLRKKGAAWLLFPKTAFWWFEYYPEFHRYLELNYPVAIRDPKNCVVYALTPAAARWARQRGKRIHQPELNRIYSQAIAPNHRALSSQGPETTNISVTVEPPSAISVVIPTFNRANFLEAALQSLAGQSLERNNYEVLVIDDGSTDHTCEVAKSFFTKFRLRYFSANHSGIAAAKNRGLHESKHAIVFFFDDDDVADRHLLREHLQSHQEHPQETTAILGYTAWARSLRITEVMRFVTGIGHYLFAYGGVEMGEPLDFTYFWGGRTSCKRTFLEKHGSFYDAFQFGCEDIELAYRLSQHGLQVILNRCAVQYMNRAITFPEFCRRCEKQGRSQFEFSRLHPDPVIRRWCGVIAARERWQERKPALAKKVARVHQIESLLNPRLPVEERSALLKELHKLYWWSFDSFKLKGIVEKMNASIEATTARQKRGLAGARLSAIARTLPQR